MMSLFYLSILVLNFVLLSSTTLASVSLLFKYHPKTSHVKFLYHYQSIFTNKLGFPSIFPRPIQRLIWRMATTIRLVPLQMTTVRRLALAPAEGSRGEQQTTAARNGHWVPKLGGQLQYFILTKIHVV